MRLATIMLACVVIPSAIACIMRLQEQPASPSIAGAMPKLTITPINNYDVMFPETYTKSMTYDCRDKKYQPHESLAPSNQRARQAVQKPLPWVSKFQCPAIALKSRPAIIVQIAKEDSQDSSASVSIEKYTVHQVQSSNKVIRHIHHGLTATVTVDYPDDGKQKYSDSALMNSVWNGIGANSQLYAYNGSSFPNRENFVEPYSKRDRTRVQGHYRTNPDNNYYNNWSTVGNVNPHTGKIGTKRIR